jgi:hypothetical protein
MMDRFKTTARLIRRSSKFSRCERVARDLVDNRPVGGINVNRSSRFKGAEPHVENKNGGALPRRFEINRSPK